MEEVGVMQMVDSLAVGGLERVAVNIANLLPRDQYVSHLCTTRSEGPLDEELRDDVGRLKLNRSRRIDLSALKKLTSYCRSNNVQIIHAHGTALFIAALASLLPPYPKVIWHDHYGSGNTNRPDWVFKLLGARVKRIISVNRALAQWAVEKMSMPELNVKYLPNFVCKPETKDVDLDLPDKTGIRIVCLANIRREKDHITLVRAISEIVKDFPDVTLLLVGAFPDSEYLQELKCEIAQFGIASNVCFLGPRTDTAEILNLCHIGVLSSYTEGLPLALLEYGMAGLPVIATEVGQCHDVLSNGELGLLVPSRDSKALAKALRRLLSSSEDRQIFAAEFQKHVFKNYSAESAIKKICYMYSEVLK